MKSLVSTLIAVGLLAPQATYAEIVIHNSGSVTSYTSSSAHSGGQSASSGESVTTGDASASAYSETHVSSDANGSVHVKVETSENGVTETREYSNTIATNTPIKVEVRASSKNGVATSSIRVNGSDAGHKATPQESKEVSPHATTTAQESVKIFFSIKIPSIFRKILSLFSWF